MPNAQWLSVRWLQGAAGLALLGALAGPATAQDAPYPTHTVRVIVSSGPGGNPDVLGRFLAERFSVVFGKAFIVENMPGAGGAVAAKLVAKSPPDGHTLIFGDSGTMTITPAINPDIGYDPIRDFTPVTALVAVPTILVAKPALPAATLGELIALARREPGKITYGSAGVGSIHHLTMAVFAEQAGINVLHVPYRGGSAMVNGVLTGDVDVGWSGIPNVMALIEAGKLKGYCISVLARSPSTPAVPTCDELGVKGFDVASVMGLYGPAGLPAHVVERLQAETAKAMREPAMAARMQQFGMVMRENGTASFLQFRQFDLARYGAIVRKLDLKIH